MSRSSWFFPGVSAILILWLTACGVQGAPQGPVAGATKVSPRDGMVLLYVPGGTFKMGSQPYSDEEPVHPVMLAGYWIDQTDVTNAMYAGCLDEGSCQPPVRSNSYSRPDYFRNRQYATFPVIYVTWADATSYCAWAGRHLPTEAEWEKAARGSDGRIYPWGNALPHEGMLNYYYVVGDTSAVGSYPADKSPYGALDMAGNVREWVADWYAPGYYANAPGANPTGPASGTQRVVRGGSWLANEFFIRSALRVFYAPDVAFFNLGFRCALAGG